MLDDTGGGDAKLAIVGINSTILEIHEYEV